MSKKNKQKQNTPDCYVGLITDSRNLKRCLIEDLNGVYSLFENGATLEKLQSYEELIKPTIGKRWDNFDAFEKEVNMQTALTYHENLFGVSPPKDQDLIFTKINVWHKMCMTVKNKAFANETGTPTDPVSNRKSTILTCIYSTGEITEGTADVKTYQALKCLELFRACLAKEGTEEVTEGILKQYVIDNAAILKTRQDPWRIFQYYRPTLIAAKLIRRK